MDAIREQLKNPVVVGVAAFILGLIIGLVVLGWGLFPVTYVNASPQNLRAEFQQDYLRAAIDSYSKTHDATVAKQRFSFLGDAGPAALAAVVKSPGSQTPADIAAFAQAAGASTTALATAAVSTPAAGPTATAAAATTAKPSSFGRTLLPIMCVFTLLLAAALVAAFYLRNRGATPTATTPAAQAQEAARDAEYTDYAARGEEPPMAQFMASYKLGDDLFDDSFSVDSPSGEFLGECGVGISDTIGVGDPKRVTAFEVWLFDKNDIQTVTKVIMSAHAFNDEAIRQKLAAKGEPELANPGTQVVLETQTLQLVARVVDMAYGEGALPPESFFDSIILELAIWPKQA